MNKYVNYNKLLNVQSQVKANEIVPTQEINLSPRGAPQGLRAVPGAAE